ncbi:uncharacterized protein LOC132284153 [Cornus florida]|uniref:uncharacterized protein LOC132284153 n=1 Tax=Cornus florida TaxID=4283 RepID=UPI00289DC08A|nr:uncharacterized protein LOC132284153 [Cornus florida]
MGLLSLSLCQSCSVPMAAPMVHLSSRPASPSSTAHFCQIRGGAPSLSLTPLLALRRTGVSRIGRRSQVVCMAPEEEKMTRRSPLDFPIEWERPKPGRRPDIFPQFSPMKTPLPPPLPADPPEEDEEEEEKKEEEEDDPEQENPDKPDNQ